ncbi:MAG: Gfo/Idh/MocA family oxidoreductase [Gaiellaceae bacterium MAG52_C11]|nr:Gfo/Idh/MocA family oxidoreductase [Candidatus Gaiellasilicea maunaloa]
MKPVSVGVIGLGFMGSRWARALAEHPGARLAVVSDVRDELGRELGDRYGARYVADPLEAAADGELAGIAICTPEHLHLETALAAIEAGKAVMVEKPLAHTVEAAEQIRARAQALGVPVLAGHILRFEPRYAAAARAIAAGEIGAVQAVRSERIGLVSDQEILRGRTSIPLYYGVHELDLLRWYAGDVERVCAERSEGVLRARGYDVEDLYSAVLRFRDGAHGTVMIGWSLPAATPGYGIAGMTVIGERGVVRVTQGELGIQHVGEGGLRDLDVHYAPEVHGRLWGALAIEVNHFVACANGSAKPLCTAHDGTEAVRLGLALEESAQAGVPVSIAKTGPPP